MMNDGFARNLLEIRKVQKMTQKQLADMVGCSAAAIGWYERGEKIPTIETASKIADVFGISLDTLVGRKEQKQEIKTWGDILRQIFRLVLPLNGLAFPKDINVLIHENEKRKVLYVVEDDDIPENAQNNGEDDSAFSIIFYNSPIIGISEPLSRLFQLYIDGEIDKEVLDAWIEKKATEFDSEKVGEETNAPQK